MCRSIHRLREGSDIGDRESMDEAALQYVRKVSGFSKPAVHNEDAFNRAINEVADATQRLMETLVVR